MFIPIMCIMFIQAGIIITALLASGATRDLNNNSIAMLEKSVQNRGENLQDFMVHYWSNIDRFEHEVGVAIAAYLEAHGIALEDLLGNRAHEIALMGNIAPYLIDALRTTSSTGVFMYFLCPGGFREDIHRLNGLYIRDFSPVTRVHANLLFIRGYFDIARRLNITHEGAWEEYFTFDPANADTWRGFAAPQLAAMRYPDAHSHNLSFWNAPHYLNPNAPSNPMITYTRPVRFGGRVIAIIGTEKQVSRLEQFFPQRDLDYFAVSGYMLLQYNTDAPTRLGEVFNVTGAYINRLLGPVDYVTLEPSRREPLYRIAEHPEVHLLYFPLHLYNPASPFAHQQWALAAMSTEQALFAVTRLVTTVILLGSLLACALSGFFLFFTLRRITNPLRAFTHQLGTSAGDSLITHKTHTYEIGLLADTINDITRRRMEAEKQIREEHQRYLMVLESSTDTFIEYDVTTDVLTTFYFDKRKPQPLERRDFADFNKVKWDIFNPDDRFNLFLSTINEIRVKASVFSHFQNAEPVDGYYWISIKSSVFYDEQGRPIKIIGTARECTQEKQAAWQLVQESRRDPATQFYNRSFGMEQVNAFMDKANLPPTVLHVRIRHFHRMELTYGLIFGAIYVAEFAHALTGLMEDGFGVRLANDEFLLFDQGKNPLNEMQIRMAFRALYAGEKEIPGLDIQIQPCGVPSDMSCCAERNDTQSHVSVNVNPADRRNLWSLTMELLERAPLINSAIQMLLRLIGRLYQLNRISIRSYDVGFGAEQLIHQWGRTTPTQGEMKKVPPDAFNGFLNLLGDRNALLFEETQGNLFLEGMLCLEPGEKASVFCCAVREDDAHTWRVLFTAGPRREWPEEEQDMLHEIAKIITTHMNVEKSRSASHAKSRFLSRISHEIRTPMNAIIGMTQIAASAAQEGDHPTVEDCLGKIDVSSKYLLALINDVLEMSRIESGYLLKIENHPFSLRGFIDEIETVIRFSIESNGIALDVHRDFTQDWVIGDAYRLKQVLINLLGNANKFTGPGGRITFTITQMDENDLWTTLRFSVGDNGIGIPFEKQATIFDPFEQADNHMPGSPQGTGLGLSISQNIVTALGGSIELKSALNKGSEFSFTLKLMHTTEDASPAGAPAVENESKFAGKRALLVDDVDINVEIGVFLLENLGFTVDTAQEGREALDKYLNAPNAHYDVILMDVQMPVMDGIEAARAIRGNTERADAQTIPIIAFTANAFDEDLKKSVGSGMNGHLNKPIDNHELIAILNKLVK